MVSYEDVVYVTLHVIYVVCYLLCICVCISYYGEVVVGLEDVVYVTCYLCCMLFTVYLCTCIILLVKWWWDLGHSSSHC